MVTPVDVNAGSNVANDTARAKAPMDTSLAASGVDFAFESALSGRSDAGRLQDWKRAGYRIEIVFLRLASPELALRRIAARVRQGGHHVPKADVLRRFDGGWANVERVYRPLAEAWAVYDNSGVSSALLEKGP